MSEMIEEIGSLSGENKRQLLIHKEVIRE